MAYSLFSVDPESGAVMADLFPDISAQEMKWCNSCEWVDDAWVFAEENLIAVRRPPHCAGKGYRNLWRSLDGGVSWSRWSDSRLTGRDCTNDLEAAALSPPLPGDGVRLFLATAHGGVWVVDPDTSSWD